MVDTGKISGIDDQRLFNWAKRCIHTALQLGAQFFRLVQLPMPRMAPHRLSALGKALQQHIHLRRARHF